jgi:hypothetical protein
VAKTRKTFSSIRLREKQGNLIPEDQPLDETDEAIEIRDVSEYKPLRIPSKQWRDCSYDESCIVSN